MLVAYVHSLLDLQDTVEVKTEVEVDTEVDQGMVVVGDRGGMAKLLIDCVFQGGWWQVVRVATTDGEEGAMEVRFSYF